MFKQKESNNRRIIRRIKRKTKKRSYNKQRFTYKHNNSMRRQNNNEQLNNVSEWITTDRWLFQIPCLQPGMSSLSPIQLIKQKHKSIYIPTMCIWLWQAFSQSLTISHYSSQPIL
jgi:hypothetical protein